MQPKAEFTLRRTLLPQDVPAVAGIEEECFTDPWPAAGIEAELTNPYGVYVVALYDGEIAGYVMGSALYEDADVTNVAVKPDLRRLGLARAMMTDFLAQCRERNVEKVFLEVRESNLPAIHLYASFGFAPMGRRKNYYIKPMEDAIVMALSLC
jgi:ribosomal-protein-alanine N-acetyltransferase